MTGTRRYRQPVNHQMAKPGQRSVWDNETADLNVWRCSCATTLNTEAAAAEHLRVKAKAAFSRLDDGHAMATLVVSDAGVDARNATELVHATRGWYAHPQLRRRMVPFYDSWGCLAARLDWEALAGDLEAGTITAEPADLLILRIAVSLAGVQIPIRLTNLGWLGDQDIRNVRAAIGKLLAVDGEPDIPWRAPNVRDQH